jgi:putative DNA primase/helicase
VEQHNISLSAEHLRELQTASSIDPDVIKERGYVTVGRPKAGLLDEYGRDTRERLRTLGFPSWAIREDYYFPGLHIPQYTPAGVCYAGQFKPFRAVPGRDGKPQRYASAKGPSRLDVHPRWSTGGGELVPPIRDVSRRLWITEGVKKADALTSRGQVTVALAGVYNWRNVHASLGDWEDVAIRGREVIVCFDADAAVKAAVAQAMARLGKWLVHKGAARVRYLVVPGMVEGSATKGVDDWFAAGGTLEGLERAMESRPPQVTDLEDRFTDARLAETLANEALDGAYVWADGLGWLLFSGSVWRPVHEVVPLETVRQWALGSFAEAVARLKLDDRGAAAVVDGWRTMLSASRAATVLKAARGIVIHHVDEFDADADHLNTRSGYLDLSTGVARPVGETEYPMHITGAHFDPEARSEVWEDFLARILPNEHVRQFVQRLVGYSLIGEVREHVMPIFTGEGANGKGTLRDALLAALGDYALEVDPELLMVRHNARHATFLMELMGRRLVFCSETNRDRRFNESEMKRLVGGEPIQANRMRENPITFKPSHTLIMCTNHLPKVSGDDPATWRRILVVPFDVVIPLAERDGRLPARLCEPDVQRAVLAWAYEGLRQYERIGLCPPTEVQARTEAYRGESDVTGRFLTECVQRAPGSRTTGADLHLAYTAWFRAEVNHGESPLGRADFTRDIAKRGYMATKSHGLMIFRDISVMQSGEED